MDKKLGDKVKKRNNKIIILVVSGIIFLVLLGIFILNYTKDDSSFSILEKKWLNDNKSNVIDVSVYNDVPIYGKNGSGVIFDFLNSFTEKYGINFNKVSYSIANPTNLKDMAFKIVSNNTKITDNDILLYEDYYVLVSKNKKVIDRISDIEDINIAVLEEDIGLTSNYLSDAKNVSYNPKKNISEIKSAFENNEIEYALIPYNTYIDFILENDLNILFHLSDVSKKYILSVNNNTLLNIIKKYYLQYQQNDEKESYKKNFLNEFFIDKKISEADRMSYNATSYTVGYVTYMPFENIQNNEFVGTLSNYLGGFEDLFDIDFKLVYYDNIDSLRKDLSSGELDLAFEMFNSESLNIDIINTLSPFKEEYVILSKEAFVINSVKGLYDREVKTIKDSYLEDLLIINGIKVKSFENTDTLLRNIGNTDIVVIDKETYSYYKNSKFGDYNIIYNGVLPYEYSFLIRDVDKNSIFAKMFNYYVSSVNYEEIKYKYNTTSGINNFNTLLTFLIAVASVLLITFILFIVKKKKAKELLIKNNDKLRYIDAMTSLKNRTYLNAKIKEWDENVIYPQAFVVVDLNNIKYINDNKGHEEGDMVIKKAASILIVDQEANTDIIRTDGNEFLIYMVGYDEKAVVTYTRKIYKDLKELPYGFGAAIGYSMILDDVKTVDDAINEATLDMRNKKENM